MKKTILITLSMLCAFAIAAAVLSNQLTNMWKSPQQDSIDLSVSSPVEQVEQIYKEYRYTTDISDSFKNEYYYSGTVPYRDGMISFGEAVSIAGGLLENVLPFLNIDDIVFIAGIIERPNTDTEEYLITYKETGDNNINWNVKCYINAVTGEAAGISFYRHLQKRDDEVIKGIVEQVEKDPEQFLKDKSINDVYDMGYEKVTYSSIITEKDSSDKSYTVSVTAKINERTDLLLFYYVYDVVESFDYEYISYNCHVFTEIG